MGPPLKVDLHRIHFFNISWLNLCNKRFLWLKSSQIDNLPQASMIFLLGSSPTTNHEQTPFILPVHQKKGGNFGHISAFFPPTTSSCLSFCPDICHRLAGAWDRSTWTVSFFTSVYFTLAPGSHVSRSGFYRPVKDCAHHLRK